MNLDFQRLDGAIAAARSHLLAWRGPQGHWTGELSASAVSTAAAVCALATVNRDAQQPMIHRGLNWLANNANQDGGWGDTPVSPSNISATLLSWSAFAAGGADEELRPIVENAQRWIARYAGGLGPEQITRAIEVRYGKDRTFAVPILTMAVIAGRLGPAEQAWGHVAQLPFELAALPHRLLKWLRLPVVSYAMPALIAIGQVRHYHRPTRCPLTRLARTLTRRRTLQRLQEIQPATGGFLESPPLTAFVVMSLAAMGLHENSVVRKGVDFLISSARSDGGWPIDTNLATWTTTLAINALAVSGFSTDPLDPAERAGLRDWLLAQQYRTEHPYTRAAPGGWAWTDLPGGVPDADDTAGAMLALRNLGAADERTVASASAGAAWLMQLQNSDGGMPTFCRGWATMAFDRSTPDLTAHALLAWNRWRNELPSSLHRQFKRSTAGALAYLVSAQREDGAWSPLWFGNESAAGQENPTYGTARVLLALAELLDDDDGFVETMLATGTEFLLSAQHPDGGWGGDATAPASIEETALAVDALAKVHINHGRRQIATRARLDEAIRRGTTWLIDRTADGTRFEPNPIGLYFARLLYYECLYPMIFTVSALQGVRRANL